MFNVSFNTQSLLSNTFQTIPEWYQCDKWLKSYRKFQKGLKHFLADYRVFAYSLLMVAAFSSLMFGVQLFSQTNVPYLGLNLSQEKTQQVSQVWFVR